jgi:hypothetical protein
MRYGFCLLPIVCLCFISLRAMAMASNYVSVNCYKQHVVITSDYAEPPPTSNPDGFDLSNYGQTSECKLKSGDIVRVRMGFDYDSDHYDQYTWVSAWFDRMKWVSKVNVEVESPTDPRAERIDISKDGVKVCTVLGPILSDNDENDAQQQKPSCKYTARTQLADVVDSKEPEHLDSSDNPLNPPDVLFGHDNSMCESMAAVNQGTRLNGDDPVAHLWLNFPDGTPIRVWQSKKPNDRGWYVDERSDFENTGSRRHIYYTPVGLSYYKNYDLYVLLDDEGYRKYLESKETNNDLLKYAEVVWPQDWAGVTERLNFRKEIDGLPGRLAITLAIKDGSSEKISLPVSNVSISPFKYKGEMYLLLANRGEGGGYAFVIRPHPKGKFDQVCTFAPGVPNF